MRGKKLEDKSTKSNIPIGVLENREQRNQMEINNETVEIPRYKGLKIKA